jgi:flagellin
MATKERRGIAACPPSPRGIGVATQQEALDTLAALDSYAQEVATLRVKVGSALIRVEEAMRVLRSSSPNLQPGDGRIRDVDLAEETAGLARQCILEHPGEAVLAQANVDSAVVLRLLS